MSYSTEIVVVVPAYNEEPRIEAVVRQWVTPMVALRGEMVVVNDGSTDGTGAILDRLSRAYPWLEVIHQVNGGHGAALLTGFQRALQKNPGFIFHTDGDGEVGASQFDRIWSLRQQAELVIGVRRGRRTTWIRRAITRGLIFLNRWAFSARFQDINVPFRLYSNRGLRDVLSVLPPAAAFPNLLAGLWLDRHGRRVLEVKLDAEALYSGNQTLVSLGLVRACVKAFGELIRWRWVLSRGGC